MNSAEISAVLSELNLEGSLVQQVWQTGYDTLRFEFYRPTGTFILLVSLKNGVTRLHASTSPFPSKGTPARFAEMLRSRIRGAHVRRASQFHNERIVELVLEQASVTYKLLFRLWGSSANAFLCTEALEILDCCYRRPQRDETSGGHFVFPEPRLEQKTPRVVRPLGGAINLNQALDTFYREAERTELTTRLREKIKRLLDQSETRQQARLSGFERQKAASADAERYQFYGDALSANLYAIKRGQAEIKVDDWNNPGSTVTIPLELSLNPQENAARWYKKARKLRDSLKNVEDSIERCRNALAQVEQLRAQTVDATRVDALESIAESAEALEIHRIPTKTGEEDEEAGARFLRHGFQILVGRSAEENDSIMRHYARGNDWWLHARDWPGSSVFVRTPKAKSVPLDVLIDAGHLALWYSKGRDVSAGDVYYTQIKYVRRAKDGPKGLFLPTQEKNLHIVIDRKRLDNILGRDLELAPGVSADNNA